MPKKIAIQSGHWGKIGAGAPGEREGNKRIVDRLCAVLRGRGFEVYQTDYYAFNDPKITKVDYDLFLSCHMDMDYPNDSGSGFADYADPATDSATIESQRICKVINNTYFPEVKINYISRSNANTRFYYVWKSLTAKTPCVLLEMGQSIDPHDSILLANTNLIVNAIARSLCLAFGIPYNLPAPIVPPSLPTPTTQPLAIPDERLVELETLNHLVTAIKAVIWSKGFIWAKINKLKTLLPKA